MAVDVNTWLVITRRTSRSEIRSARRGAVLRVYVLSIVFMRTSGHARSSVAAPKDEEKINPAQDDDDYCEKAERNDAKPIPERR